MPNSEDTEAKLWQFSQITPEVRFGNIQPDLMVMVDKDTYFIEIAVTSFVDEIKLERIKTFGTPTIELDLGVIRVKLSFLAMKQKTLY